MVRIRSSLIICIALVTLLSLATQTMTSSSSAADELQSRFGRALGLVHRAEVAGATEEETAGLVVLLNKALQLDDEATRLPSSAPQRSMLLAQAEDILGKVEMAATQVEVTASQRTSTDRIVAYVSGGVASFLATLAYAYVSYVRQRYRVKRTFQMRISPK